MKLFKVFDSIDYKLLSNKLNIYGIKGTALKLIHSYFHNKYKFKVINNMHVELNEIYSGAPQGSKYHL